MYNTLVQPHIGIGGVNQVRGFPLCLPPVSIIYNEREEQWRAASPIVEVGDTLLGDWFPLLFCHLGAMEVCGSGQIPGFTCFGGSIGLFAAGFLEFGHDVVSGGLAVIGCLLDGLLLAVAELPVV